MEKQLFLETRGLTKRFGEVLAVNHVDMQIFSGEIRGLIGENGSGKSTISSMISGLHTVTSGEMFLKGEPYHPSGALDARRHAIVMIVQEVGTIDGLSVAENIFLGEERRFGKGGFIDKAAMIREAEKALAAIGAENIKAADSINRYNFEDRKLVEIARGLWYQPELFIVDETTTALSHEGRGKIHEIMRELKKQGKAVLFISHELPELMETCDTLTVLRDGELIANIAKEDFEESFIKQTMVGRVIEGDYYRSDFDPSHGEKVMLRAENLTGGSLQRISLELHEGEIVGIGGLSGSGMHDLGKALFGMGHLSEGKVEAWLPERTEGRKRREASYTEIRSIADAFRANIGYISKDRDKETLILPASIRDNLTISALDELGNRGVITPSSERTFAQTQKENFKIKCSSINQPVKELSGGNKQKVSFAKWIGKGSRILIFDSPTRGVDIGVKTTMYQLLYRLKKEGYAILIISEELPELIGMSDRLLIMKDGKVTKEFVRDENLTDSAVIEYMI